jgi:hypothetical protein
MAASDDGSVLHSIILINCEVGMWQYLRICAPLVCVPKKNTEEHARTQKAPSENKCSSVFVRVFVYLCIP